MLTNYFLPLDSFIFSSALRFRWIPLFSVQHSDSVGFLYFQFSIQIPLDLFTFSSAFRFRWISLLSVQHSDSVGFFIFISVLRFCTATPYLITHRSDLLAFILWSDYAQPYQLLYFWFCSYGHMILDILLTLDKFYCKFLVSQNRSPRNLIMMYRGRRETSGEKS